MNVKHLFLTLLVCDAFFSFAQKIPNKKHSPHASYYNNSFHGLETSNGEVYNKNDFTAAHRSLPFNTLLLVTNKTNKKSVVVRVNDRGPFKKSRVLDLSYAAAKKIEMVPFGVVPVKIDVLTYLDNTPIPEPLLQENNIWSCYGNKEKLYDQTVYIWQTDNWKHALYMASNLNMDLNLLSLVVKITGTPKNKMFALLVTGIKDSQSSEELIKQLKTIGFFNARIFKDVPAKELPHDGL